ncbi:P-loop containing nucleoside triphosphate hydrolase protein [Tricharina praecox]|uniref:P-loop containing nucleoside triphosphate hydrolase protein n=1 Tax=Tricharina praecox TaxID=43433 RepID=UPI00221EC27F|nr:P-loop containing nucleoside triphosphate hydrolase protein [Tricharina praecox]KAI5852201.1 P-loop containing nucleoside triphosphate hydrolase protein [Tricharina praecox]
MHMRRFLTSAATPPASHAIYSPVCRGRYLLASRCLYLLSNHGRCLSASRAVNQQPQKPVRSPPPVELRPYQGECIDTVLANIYEECRRMVVCLPTGSGKTVIFTHVISRMEHPSRPQHATRTLILTHRHSRVRQAYEQCHRAHPSMKIDVEMGKCCATGEADITIASIASISNEARLGKFDAQKYKLVIIDEAHNAVNSQYQTVLDYFGVLNMGNGDPRQKPVVLGLTATIERPDEQSLGKVFDRIVYRRSYADLLTLGWLCPHKIVSNGTDVSRLSDDKRNVKTVHKWLQLAQDRKSTIVFCADTSQAEDIMKKFRNSGIDARLVTTYTTWPDRTAILNAFKAGAFPVLVNCRILAEGAAIPRVDCIVLAYHTKNGSHLGRMVGQGTHLHPSKADCLVIDMCRQAGGKPVIHPLPVEALPSINKDEPQALPQPQTRGSEVTDTSSSPESPQSPPPRPLHWPPIWICGILLASGFWMGNMM